MAGAANMATGILHSVANAFGNAGSALKKSAELSKLYNSGVCGDICRAIRKDCLMFYNIMEEILSNNGFRSYDVPGRIQKADAIYHQLEEGVLPESSYAQAIAKMISIFPGKFEYYSLACNLLGGSNGALRKLVERFELDIEEYDVIEASAEWRRLIFGDFLDTVKDDKSYKFSYLKSLCYSKWGNGIIDELQHGPVDAIAEIITRFIDEFKEEKKNKEIELLTFENGSNAYLLALFENRNVKLGYMEVPILAINIAEQIMKGGKSSEHILLTSQKIYYVSKKGEYNKTIPVQEIRSVDFYDNEYGVQINDHGFAPKICLSSDDSYDFRSLLCSIIAIIQCLQSVGHSARSCAIIDGESLDKDYGKANNI